jgi:TldD protein
VLAVTAIRQVDADFLEIPRQELADAALSAATAAGASHADLRIHRIVNDMVLYAARPKLSTTKVK